VIDKDKIPRWTPPSLAEVDPARIARWLEPRAEPVFGKRRTGAV
jgi:enoyl-CoA hydratase